MIFRIIQKSPRGSCSPEAASGSSSQSLVVLLLWQQPLDPLEQEDKQALSSSIQAQSHLYHCHGLVSHQRSSRKESGKLLKENDPLTKTHCQNLGENELPPTQNIIYIQDPGCEKVWEIEFYCSTSTKKKINKKLQVGRATQILYSWIYNPRLNRFFHLGDLEGVAPLSSNF